MGRISILFLLLAWWPLGGGAVERFTPRIADPILEPWRWRHIPAVESVGALCVDQAPDGALWFGGTGGLCRYDGLSVEHMTFSAEFIESITHREAVPWVKCLLSVSNDEILALIGESLVLWSRDEWRVVIQDVGQTVFFNSLIRGVDGSYWLQVREGLWRVGADFEDVSRVITTTRQRRLMAVCSDMEGDIWVVQATSMDRVQLIEIPIIEGSPRSERQWFSCSVPFVNDSDSARIVAGSEGRIWYVDGSSRSDLIAFDPQEDRWIKARDALEGKGLYSLVKLGDGSLWAGGEGSIARRSPQGNMAFYERINLDLPLVPLTLRDFGDGRLWVLGRGGRVYFVDLAMEEWKTYAGLNYQCEAPNGLQWFLSGNGDHAVSHDPASGEWLRYDAEDGMISRGSSINIGRDGMVWVTGAHDKHAAIALFDGRRWTRRAHPEFAEWIEPNGVLVDSDGGVWLGAGGTRRTAKEAGGALRYGMGTDGKPVLKERYGTSIFPYYALTFAETKEKRVLIGSTIVHAYGLGADATEPLLQYPRENTVTLAFDQQDRLWVAKEHAGVFARDESGWTRHAMRKDIAGSLLSSVLILSDGTVLAATDRGVSRFDGDRWENDAYPEEFAMSRRWSGVREGRDGSIWLNYDRTETQRISHLLGGASVARATRHRPESKPPQTYITEYLEHVAQPGNVHVRWAARDLWEDTPPELLRFSWRMDGGAWSPFEASDGRMFPNVPHGRHVLEVRARDRAFNIDPTPARVEFVVEPPLWLSAWFISMLCAMTALILITIWIWVHSRVKRLRDKQDHLIEMDRLKTSFFTNLSHELRTPLTVMLSPLESLRDSERNEGRREKISMVIRSAERVTTLLTQLLDFRKIEQGAMSMRFERADAVACARAAFDLLKPMAQARRVECEFESPDSRVALIDEDKLRKITSNLVGNAIKYTRPGGAVSVRLSFASGVARDTLALVVEDSGAGIEPEHLEHVFDRFFRGSEKTAVDGSGIGLNLTKELVVLWGGTIRAESPIHEDVDRPGARFVVELPLRGDTADEGKDGGNRND